MKAANWFVRAEDELAQVWTVALKDIKVYYLKPGIIMFGFLMPFFLFFSFSVQREQAIAQGMARLLTMTIFFTAGAVGPMIIPLERAVGTYDRLLAAPMSRITLLMGKVAVGAFFAISVSALSLSIGVVALGATVASIGFLIGGLVLGAFSFSSLGIVFGSIPTRNPGEVQMPSTLLRWGLLFISGIFVPLKEMVPLARGLAYLSPLTYAQDLMNHAVMGQGIINPWLSLGILLATSVVFLLPSLYLHRRARRLGY